MSESKDYKILIADDMKMNLFALKSILEDEYTVIEACNGRDTIKLAEEHLPDVILLDIVMPEMNGYEVISVLKNNIYTQSIPVIFITGLSGDENEEKGLSMGAADFILKPFSPAIVKLRVKNQILMLSMLQTVEQKNMSYNRQNSLLHTVNRAADALLTVEDDETFEASLLKGMEIIAHGVGVDCVEVWQNELKDGELYAVLKHSWLSEEAREVTPVSPATVFSYKDTPQWESRLSRGDHIQGPVSELSPEDREFLSVFKLTSVLAIPLFLQGRFWGLFCIDDHFNARSFTEDEISILHSVAHMLTNAVNRQMVEAATRRAEIAEESSRAKSRFLATMSHEIRTPINGIMGFAELALDTPAIDSISQVKNFVEKIKKSAVWLTNIVNDILDISKIEQGRMGLENAPFDIQEVIARCKAVIMPTLTQKGLEFVVHEELLTGKKPVGDSVRLYQMLIKLLSNAVKFTDTGSVILSSYVTDIHEADMRQSAPFSEGAGVKICFEVKDTGIGMSSEQVEKIFDPFSQADSSTTRTYGGTGLGLAIVKNLVDLMGGTISVDSEPGVGSVFRFELVFETIDVSDAIDPAKLNLLEKPYFNGTVLICEDNPMNQQVICEHLENIGLRTIVAEDGKKGVEMVQDRISKGEKPFDLILMDMFMPVMDGIEAASRIVALKTGSPIVAMTANIMAGDLENYRKHGMPDCVGKPFTAQELWRTLLKYLKPVEVCEAHNAEHGKQNAELSPRNAQLDGDVLRKKLLVSFVKSNQNTYDDTLQAIEAGDIKLAHRLAHTLKGSSGLIGKSELQNAASRVESLLRNSSTAELRSTQRSAAGDQNAGTPYNSESPIPISNLSKALDEVKRELDLVLDKLRPLLTQSDPTPEPKNSNYEQALDLFDRLELMLQNINPECANLADEVRSIPGAEELAHQLEDYEFVSALQTLTELRKTFAHQV